MSIRSVMNKRLESFYKSQKIFDTLTKELATAKDPVLSHIPPGFRFDTAAVQFTNHHDPSTITFKEAAGTHCAYAPPILNDLQQALVPRNSVPNPDWLTQTPSVFETNSSLTYISNASSSHHKRMHNTQTVGKPSAGLETSMSSMNKKLGIMTNPEDRVEQNISANVHLINQIATPIWYAMGLDCNNSAFRILPDTIRYKNGPHIPFNSTYIGLPVGTTFTVHNRNDKKDWITYKIVGKLINFEATPRPLTQAQVQALTCTDPTKYIPTDTYAKQLTNHLIVEPIDVANPGIETYHGSLRHSALFSTSKADYDADSLPIIDANGYLTMNRQLIKEWLHTSYKDVKADPNNDTVVIDGQVTNKGGDSGLTMSHLMHLQKDYNEFNIIPDTLDLFIDGHPLDDHTVYSVDRTTINIPAVDFTETNTYKNLAYLATRIPNYICRLVFDSPNGAGLDEEVYNFFY